VGYADGSAGTLKASAEAPGQLAARSSLPKPPMAADGAEVHFILQYSREWVVLGWRKLSDAGRSANPEDAGTVVYHVKQKKYYTLGDPTREQEVRDSDPQRMLRFMHCAVPPWWDYSLASPCCLAVALR